MGAHVIREAGNHRKYRRLVGELDASLRQKDIRRLIPSLFVLLLLM